MSRQTKEKAQTIRQFYEKFVNQHVCTFELKDFIEFDLCIKCITSTQEFVNLLNDDRTISEIAKGKNQMEKNKYVFNKLQDFLIENTKLMCIFYVFLNKSVNFIKRRELAMYIKNCMVIIFKMRTHEGLIEESGTNKSLNWNEFFQNSNWSEICDLMDDYFDNDDIIDVACNKILKRLFMLHEEVEKDKEVFFFLGNKISLVLDLEVLSF